MNNRYLTLGEDSPAVLRGVLWALATGTAAVLFVLATWLGIQREQIVTDRRGREMAERERDIAYTEKDAAIQSCNERLAQAESARATAENQAQLALQAKNTAEAQRDEDERQLTAVRATQARRLTGGGTVEPQAIKSTTAAGETPSAQAAPNVSPPSATEITDFIRAHLARMMGPVESQLGDYTEEVDFHDKPHASLRNIEAEREGWAQKWPRRIILKDEVVPQMSATTDPVFGWRATAVFNWRWFFAGRSGAAVRGVYRDTWKIVPTAQGLKIISEHSVDAITGRSRD